MDERMTTQGTFNFRIRARYVAEVLILCLGITTLTAGAASLSQVDATEGATPVVTACQTPTVVAEPTPVPRGNPYVL